MKRGDVYFAALDPSRGAEAQKNRPVVVSNNAANRASAVVTVVPLTSSVERVYPFEVLLKGERIGLDKDGKAMAQQVRTLDKARLDAALRLHLAL